MAAGEVQLPLGGRCGTISKNLEFIWGKSNDDPTTMRKKSGVRAVNSARVLPPLLDRLCRVTLVAASGCFLYACASGPDPSAFDSEVSALKTFLRDGATGRDEVLVRLGIPHATFEGNRIVGYYLSYRDELVLIFDERGVLERHRFLKFPVSQP